MQTFKKDLQIMLAEAQKRNSIMDIVLIDLVRKPEATKWFTRGTGASKVNWGVIRLTSACGGYVVIREGAQDEYVRADYLDEAVIVAREGAHHASGCGDPEQRRVYENRALVAQDVLQYRTRLLDAEAYQRTAEELGMPQYSEKQS
jgi:hypothetical protein